MSSITTRSTRNRTTLLVIKYWFALLVHILLVAYIMLERIALIWTSSRWSHLNSITHLINAFRIHGSRSIKYLSTRGVLASEHFAIKYTLINRNNLTNLITAVVDVLWILIHWIPVKNCSSIYYLKLRRIIHFHLLMLTTLLLAIISSLILYLDIIVLLMTDVWKLWLRRIQWKDRRLCPHFWINNLILCLLELCSHSSFSWDWNQVLYQCTSCEELILNIWQFVTIVNFTCIQFIFYVNAIFSRFKERQSTIENIWIKYFCYNTINKPLCKCLMTNINIDIITCIILQKWSVIHFKDYFNFKSEW